jgi:pimeloyl-ACP methyl ester carboxylesterase
MNKKSVSIGKETYAYLDEGKGETVILIHGNMSSSVHYQPLITRISKKFRCVAPDLRGFGDSTYNNRFSSLDELAEDVNLFMQQLKIDSAYVIGWSTGGGIALKLAAMYPQKVKKLFIIEGAGLKGYPIYVKHNFKSTGEAYESKEAMAKDPMQVEPVLRILEKKDAVSMTAIWDATIYVVNKPTKEENDFWMEETLKQRNLIDVDWSLATFNMSDEFTPYGKGDGSIHNIKCPVGLTMGEKDATVPDYMVMDNYNALGDLATLFPYKKCGHSPMVDCPDLIAADIEKFFKG